MTESLFDQNDNQEPSFDQTKNYLEELVGDGKKLKDVVNRWHEVRRKPMQ